MAGERAERCWDGAAEGVGGEVEPHERGERAGGSEVPPEPPAQQADHGGRAADAGDTALHAVVRQAAAVASPGGGEPSRGGGGKLQAVVGSRRLWVVGIMSGRKAIDVQHSQSSVVEWAGPFCSKAG